ncbi:BTAD domain-containing putative transcriptional regulator [Streptacidiphilus sp. N1-3]|uniref:BTAD domain-containing putative transcriptional regulator n=1 Tax=Streptacidiphilus alkalitolerans TaxID=3342712 RepID=A0ABV6WY63_9ACTN
MRFGILGSLEVTVDGRPVDLPSPRLRAALALLLLNRDRPVGIPRFVDALWGEEPPRTARAQVHTAISKLRQLLPDDALHEAGEVAADGIVADGIVADGAADGGPAAGGPGERITLEPGGYRLRAAAEDVDADCFADLVAAARDLQRSGDRQAALGPLRSGLALWRGEALSAIEAPFAAASRTRLQEERRAAYELLADLELAGGNYLAVVPELTALLEEHPYWESIAERLALALSHGGRQTDALAVLRTTRDRLAQDFGLDPGPGLADLERLILRGELPRTGGGPTGAVAQAAVATATATTAAAATVLPKAPIPPTAQDPTAGAGPIPPSAATSTSPAAKDSAPAAAQPPPASGPRPAQLPAPSYGFVGRENELAALSGVRDGAGGEARVALVSGPPGVGKTSLALRWAQQHASAFQDGQLFVDLHGYDQYERESAQRVLERFLLALGVPGYQIPADQPAREDLYRSTVAGRRLLIVLDNASDDEQVRPLLPGTADGMVLVTSRGRLGGLAADTGARVIDLGMLTRREAVEALGRIVGAERVEAAPEAADALAQLCGGLPLALRISAVRLNQEPGVALAELAAELSPEEDRLAGLSIPGSSTHAVSRTLDHSYRLLGDLEARCFRLLCGFPGPALNVPAAAALLGVERGAQAQPPLRALLAAHLVERPASDRYVLHDLVRLYGRELAAEFPQEQDQALARLCDWYITAVDAAQQLLYPVAFAIPTDLRHPWTGPLPFTDRDAAVEWFGSEDDNLLALIRHGAAQGEHRVVWQLALGHAAYLLHRHQLGLLVEISELGERSALAAGLDMPAGKLANYAGIAYSMLRDLRARDAYGRAMSAALREGDELRATRIRSNLGNLHYELEQFAEAAVQQAEALAAARRLDDQQLVSALLANLALTQLELGRLEEAQELVSEAILASEKLENHEAAAVYRGQLGFVQLRRGRLDEALTLSEAALAAAERFDNPLLRGRMFDQVGQVLAALDQHERARESWQRALVLLEEIDSPEADIVRARL